MQNEINKKNEVPVEVMSIGEYRDWLSSLKQRIRSAQIKASVAVNGEMLELYWRIGRDICNMQFDAKYGCGFFQRLSSDLSKAFPGTVGFSERNIRYMKKFYVFYADKILHQAGAELDSLLFTIPWRHHVEIFTRAKSVDEALFFVAKTRENGWSRAMLINMMDTKLFETQGCAINNFVLTMPKCDSDCAREILQDKYTFDFLSLREDCNERELHDAIERNLVQFLLRLGRGFAFVGSHVPFEVNGDRYECDLLFYNLKLRRYIVVELKVVKFKPEFVSKLNFYCNAVNHLFKDELDRDSIGLLICKEKNDVVAQWTVERSNEPVGISTYELTGIIPAAKGVLPDAEEIVMSLVDKEI